MHYIIGTSFKITQASRSLLRDKRFVVNGIYSLAHIAQKNGKVVYMFVDLMRNKFEIEFNSCREADSLIAKLKNERIPNYDEPKEVVDNIAD